MTRITLSALALALAYALACLYAHAREDADAGQARLKKDVSFLASPECEGRGPRTAGLKKAGDFVAAEFRKIGLAPAFGDSYFQPFDLAATAAEVTLFGPKGQRIELRPGTHFHPLGLRQSGKGKGDVVFAGYAWQDEKAGYDDLAGLDVKGKVVVVLTGQPGVPAASLPGSVQQSRLVGKLTALEKLGAAAVLVVNDRSLSRGGDRLVDYSYGDLTRGGKHLPTVLAKREVAEAMFPPNQTLDDVEAAIARDKKPLGGPLAGWRAEVYVTRDPDAIPLRNVVGVLKGDGPLAGETVVVGAHYDHLGLGGPSSQYSPTGYAVHHGADDNASGTAGMLELARRFAATKGRQGRRLVFCAFSGEEQGLFGSKEYCSRPPFPLSGTAAMFNLDMIGRLRPDPKTDRPILHTEGHGTAKQFGELVANVAKKGGFELKQKAGGFGPSDHASFYEKKVPVLFFWTAVHDDYHGPTDTAERIDYAGMKRVVDAGEEVVKALARMERPQYVEVKGDTGPRPSTGPRLGIRPSYSDDVVGVTVEAVTPGGPAAKGGVMAADVIVGVGGQPVKDVKTYIAAMAVQKPKSKIAVEVIRGGKKLTLGVELE